MPSLSLGGLTGGRSGAVVGWLLALAATALSLPTIGSVHGAARLPVLAIFGGGLLVATVLLVGVRWDRMPRWTLLVWPTGLLVTIGVAGLLTPLGSVGTLTGVSVLAFFHVGRFQRRGTGIAMVPAGVVSLVACYGGWTHQLALRGPITIGVWVVISEALASMRDESQSLADGLDRLARTDSLTGLATRHVLHERLVQARAGDAVVIIDLDHFKAVNDERGHLAGDEVLADLGKVLLSVIRMDDLAVRFGGEELLLLLCQSESVEAEKVLTRIRAHWQRAHPGLTFSAGVAVIGNDRDATAALAAADAALYRAKQSGRDRWALAGVIGVTDDVP